MLDASGDNADWTKVQPDLPMEREALLRLLAKHGITIDEFMRLPVYRHSAARFDRILEGGE